MHLLLVEDNGTLVKLFQAQLRRLKDHTVTTASTKAEAIAAFKEKKFDVVFIDMGLEGIPYRGLEILNEIKSLAPEQRIGILSSNDAGETVRASQKAGAEFYMVKPFVFRGLKLILEGDKEAIRRYQPNIQEGEGRIITF